MGEKGIFDFSWLREINSKMIKIKEFREPKMPFDPEKHIVIGDMTDGLKKLFTIFEAAGEDYLLAVEQAREEFYSGKKLNDSAFEKLDNLKKEIDDLGKLFWLLLEKEFPQIKKGSSVSGIGVTNNFKVVSIKRDENASELTEVFIIGGTSLKGIMSTF